MKKLFGSALFFTLVMLTLLGWSNVSEATTSLPPGFLVGDDTGFQAGTDGEYFIRNDNIYPGQTFRRVITLSNYSTEDGSFAIHLVMNPEDETHQAEVSGAINLLEAVQVTLTYQGSIIYEGPIDGNGTPVANKQAAPIQLGSLEVGEVRNIQADFTVSRDYPMEDWKDVSAADFYWLFYASRETTTPSSSNPPVDSSDSGTQPTTSTSNSLPSTGKLPQTGEDWRNVLLGMIAGIALLTVALVITKKRHDSQRNN